MRAKPGPTAALMATCPWQIVNFPFKIQSGIAPAKAPWIYVMKVSQMLIDYASDFIAMADTLDEKQSRLNAACSAWNIAILPKHQRKKALSKYLKSLKKYDPQQNNLSHIRQDIELLIRQKNKMFPEVKKPIVDAEIREEGGKYTIFAASVRNT
jgi:hypothetical protein